MGGRPGLVYKNKEDRPLGRAVFTTHKKLIKDFDAVLKEIQDERRENLDPVPTKSEIYRHLQVLFICFGQDLLNVQMEQDLKKLVRPETI